MLWEMDISIISGQLALLHVKLEPGDGFEVYGGTSEDGLRVERQSESEWLVTMDEQDVAGRPLVRYNLYARQVASGREWAILGGKVMVSQRTATVPGDKLAPVEYFVTVPVLENAVDLTGTAIVTGIVGPRGYSAYEVAVMEGFVGSEAEWLEYMRQQTATLAVEQVTPLVEQAETAANKAEAERKNAAQHALDARQFASKAEDNATEAENQAMMAEDSRIQAAREVDKAAAEVKKAKLERETAAGHAAAAAKSEQNALAAQQGAERAEQDAAQAQVAAQTAKTEAEAAMTQAQTAKSNAKAHADTATAAKTAAEQAKQDAQAAQSKAEQEASKAEQNAALLGDAAMQGGDNVFSGRNVFAGVVQGGLEALRGECLAALVAPALHWWNAEFDWYKRYAWDKRALSVFPNLTHFLPGTAEPDWTRLQKAQGYLTDCPLKAIPEGWTGAGLTREGNSPDESSWDGPFFSGEYLPETWTTPDLVYANDMYAKSSFEYMPEGTTFENVTQLGGCWRENKKLRRLPAGMNLSRVEFAIRAWQGCTALEALPESFTGAGVKNLRQCIEGTTIKEANCVVGAEAVSWCSFANGGKLQEMHAVDCSAAKSCDGAWNGCALDKVTVLRICGTLPAWTDDTLAVDAWCPGFARRLNLGVDKALKGDADVLEAIAAAEAKGWLLVVQWNARGGVYVPPESGTYGLRRPVIYARVTVHDGERSLDWGDYVSDPSGYEEFESVEAARAYYGLPDENLTETE